MRSLQGDDGARQHDVRPSFIAGHVPCDMAAQAAAVALALACSNADDAEALLDDACKTASDYLTTITTVH